MCDDVRWTGGGSHCNSQTFMLISLEFTEQEAVLTLPFEHCGLESLDKILQEGF